MSLNPAPASVYIAFHTSGNQREKVGQLCSSINELINSAPEQVEFVVSTFNNMIQTILCGRKGSRINLAELEEEVFKNINRSNKAFVYDAWGKLLENISNKPGNKCLLRVFLYSSLNLSHDSCIYYEVKRTKYEFLE
jgi:hypothetical protein